MLRQARRRTCWSRQLLLLFAFASIFDVLADLWENSLVSIATKIVYKIFRLGDILSQRQIVPPAFFGRQIVPDDKMSHFLPMRQIVPATKCPISSPATKCPTDDPTEKPLFHWHFSGDKLSQGDKMSHFLPGDKMSQLMHLCTWKLWKVVGTFCRQWKRLLGQFVASEKGQYWAYLGGYFSVRRHYNITVY